MIPKRVVPSVDLTSLCTDDLAVVFEADQARVLQDKFVHAARVHQGRQEVYGF